MRSALLFVCVLAQAFIPSVVYSYLVLVPTLVPSAFVLLFVSSLAAQWLLRSTYVALFIAGILLWWNVTPPDYLFYLGFITPSDIPLPTGVLVAFILAAVIFTVPLVRPHKPARSVRIVVATAAFVLVALKFTPLNNDQSRVGIHLKEPTLRFVAWAKQTLGPDAARYASRESASSGSVRPTPAVSFASWARQESLQSRNLVLVMVESWAEEPAQLQEIRNRLTSVGVRVDAWGFVDSFGGTLEAEVRELCGYYTDHAHSIGRETPLEDCIPWELRRRGYRAVGIHGYKGDFYLRNVIWPKMGLADLYFKEGLASQDLCLGTFLGVCDSAVIGVAFDQLAGSTPTFVHALMLNSHEPMPAGLIDQPCPLLADLASIGQVQVQARRVLCYVTARLRSGVSAGPVSVYVVGDHPPPLSRGLSERAMQQVPYLVLGAE